ncbi:MAG: SiaB family protein kinase [Bacteroidetes bacterium]|nr:SiaB family protein kinase [Bacteroidota bacterium]
MRKIEDFALDLNHRLHKHDVILAFAGEIDNKTMNTIIGNIDDKIEKLSLDPITKKRFYHVMVECLENLYRHNEPIPNQNSTETPFAVFTLLKENEDYFLTTGNYIKNDQVDVLKDKIEKINRMTLEEKKIFYREVLSNKTFSEKGGAGLGMIDIALRSSDALSYEFKPINDNYSFYVFQTKILN